MAAGALVIAGCAGVGSSDRGGEESGLFRMTDQLLRLQGAVRAEGSATGIELSGLQDAIDTPMGLATARSETDRQFDEVERIAADDEELAAATVDGDLPASLEALRSDVDGTLEVSGAGRPADLVASQELVERYATLADQIAEHTASIVPPRIDDPGTRKGFELWITSQRLADSSSAVVRLLVTTAVLSPSVPDAATTAKLAAGWERAQTFADELTSATEEPYAGIIEELFPQEPHAALGALVDRAVAGEPYDVAEVLSLAEPQSDPYRALTFELGDALLRRAN